MTPEGKVKAHARAYAHKLGLWTVPYNATGLGKAGIPDDLMVVCGHFITIEFKAKLCWSSHGVAALHTLPTVLQCKTMEEIRAAGGSTLVVDGPALADYYSLLDRLKTCVSAQQAAELADTSWLAWRWSFFDYSQYQNLTAPQAQRSLLWSVPGRGIPSFQFKDNI